MVQHNRPSARQEDRRPLALRAEFEIAGQHREQVRFSGSSTAPQPHVTAGTSVDISGAGLAVLCEQFVPRMTEGTVRLYLTAEGKEAAPSLAFEHLARVRRVTLRADKPAYLVGLAFVDPQPQVNQAVAQLVQDHGQASAGGMTHA